MPGAGLDVGMRRPAATPPPADAENRNWGKMRFILRNEATVDAWTPQTLPGATFRRSGRPAAPDSDAAQQE